MAGKKNKPHGIKHKIREEKKKEQRIGLAVTAIILITIISISGFLINSMLNQPSISQAISSASELKAAIVDHLSLTRPNQAFIETATNILKQANYSVDYYPGEEVTVDFYRSLLAKGYGLLILRVHSASYDEDKEPFFFTSQPYSKTQCVHEQLTDQVKIAVPEMPASQLSSGNFPKYFGIGPKFIQQTSLTRLGNATIIAMGCDVLKYTSMAEAFIEKGAKVYIGWDGSILGIRNDPAITCLLQHLITEKQTVEKAVAETMKEFGPSPIDNSRLLYYPLEAGELTIEDIKNNH